MTTGDPTTARKVRIIWILCGAIALALVAAAAIVAITLTRPTASKSSAEVTGELITTHVGPAGDSCAVSVDGRLLTTGSRVELWTVVGAGDLGVVASSSKLSSGIYRKGDLGPALCTFSFRLPAPSADALVYRLVITAGTPPDVTTSAWTYAASDISSGRTLSPKI